MKNIKFPYQLLQTQLTFTIANQNTQWKSNNLWTYGDIAKNLGNKKLARSIGKILHNNPNLLIVPCYKVVL